MGAPEFLVFEHFAREWGSKEKGERASRTRKEQTWYFVTEIGIR